MKLYFYQGLDNEFVPKDVTRVIVDNNVTVIKKRAVSHCTYLVSVVMGDNIKGIEDYAFYGCRALLFIRLSKTLEYIGRSAFYSCGSLETLFLPSAVKSIEAVAFMFCRSLRLLILPHDINLNNVGNMIISDTGINQITKNAGVTYACNDESSRRVNEWLIHHMDEAPFHKVFYNSSITTKQINEHLTENGDDSALAIDPYHGMTPLHLLSMNPHAPAETIAALLDVNMEVAFRLDSHGKLSLDYARDYNVGGLVGTINGLCNHRHAA